MSLTLMLISGVVTGLYFDVLALAALCFATMLVGVVCVAATGFYQPTMTLAFGILILQIGYVIGILVFAFELASRSGARLTPDS